MSLHESPLHIKLSDVIDAIVLTRRHLVGILYVKNCELKAYSNYYFATVIHMLLVYDPKNNSLQAYLQCRISLQRYTVVMLYASSASAFIYYCIRNGVHWRTDRKKVRGVKNRH